MVSHFYWHEDNPPPKLVVRSRLSDEIRCLECKVGEGVPEALDELLRRAITDAVLRAKANGRKVVRACDVLPSVVTRMEERK